MLLLLWFTFAFKNIQSSLSTGAQTPTKLTDFSLFYWEDSAFSNEYKNSNLLFNVSLNNYTERSVVITLKPNEYFRVK